ncbi:MAG TPA: hypothetical protein VK827_08965, partial [Lysobacter sp.]|nr:hypothetical protein [Lysobacter sp.]
MREQTRRDDAEAEGSAVHKLLVDAQGLIHGVEGASGGSRCILDLLPGVDAAAFGAFCAAAEAAPAGILRFDIAVPDAPVVPLMLSRAPGTPARYLATLGQAHGNSTYRRRLGQRLAFERLIAALSTDLIHAPSERLDA